MKICDSYCGLACVNGYCPIAFKDEYAEIGMDIIEFCKDCCYYMGCEDCIIEGSEICILNKTIR